MWLLAWTLQPAKTQLSICSSPWPVWIAKLKVTAKQVTMTLPSQDSFLSDYEWTTVVVLIEALAPFQEVTLDLSSEQYPTLGSPFVIFWKITSHCAKLGCHTLQLHVNCLIEMLQAKTTTCLNALSKQNQYLANLSMIVGLKSSWSTSKVIRTRKKFKVTSLPLFLNTIVILLLYQYHHHKNKNELLSTVSWTCSVMTKTTIELTSCQTKKLHVDLLTVVRAWSSMSASGWSLMFIIIHNWSKLLVTCFKYLKLLF
jgi:hypothetical protein